MSINETIPFDVAFRQLEREFFLATNTPLPDYYPEYLELEDIFTAETVFQPRGFEDVASSENHIRVLMDATLSEPSKQLDPIVIWWSGKCWRVIDGHHRLMAYQRLSDIGSATPLIPVTVFQGTLKEAFIESTKLNSKDKLPMTRDDKLNRAWQMVIIGDDFSKRTISESCKVSTASVARMRSKLREIQESYPDEWLELVSELSWKEVLNFDQKDRVIDEEWEERQAIEWSRRLGKTFGKKLATQPQVAWRAIELYSPQLARDFEEYTRFLEHDDF